MIKLLSLSEDQVRSAMNSGEFDDEITKASRNVAVVLTQGWCPQWLFMNAYLKKLAKKKGDDHPELTVYTLEYDKVPYFQEFMGFKEKVFKNALVPYIRYYREGELIDSSNYVSQPGFLAMFE